MKNSDFILPRNSSIVYYTFIEFLYKKYSNVCVNLVNIDEKIVWFLHNIYIDISAD